MVKTYKRFSKNIKRKISVKQKEENKVVEKHIKKGGLTILEIRVAKAVEKKEHPNTYLVNGIKLKNITRKEMVQNQKNTIIKLVLKQIGS